MRQSANSLTASTPLLQLAFGLQFADLYRAAGLHRLDDAFLQWLEPQHPELKQQLVQYRQGQALAAPAMSQWLIDLAPLIEGFLVELFGIQAAHQALVKAHQDQELIFTVKRKFVQRQALRSISADEALQFNETSVREEFFQHLEAVTSPASSSDFEARFAQAITHWEQTLELSPSSNAALESAKRYAAWAVHTPSGRAKHQGQVLFKQAQGIDPEQLMPHAQRTTLPSHTVHFLPTEKLRERAGFSLTDAGRDTRYAIDQSRYCIWCHGQGKDSCSHGIKKSKSEREALQITAVAGKEIYKQSAHGVTLAGCPLEERISEFQYLKAHAKPIAALAMICLDNPMLAATGHRICNDCVKACIYQKQEGVDIPQVETRTLKDVLALPWGVEIYSLLTRWNPLNLALPFTRAASGKTVMVVGQGPAGFTLAHHLLNLGHSVFAIDGLKITPWKHAFEPVHNFEALQENLNQRELAGFGGVAEYGITVRWDKNFLTLIRLLLERREYYQLKGGVRLGSNITTMQALEMGVDHIALAIGAGKPTMLTIAHGLAKGVRTASDFLMALQLTGAARETSLANLQVRLPILVIGGGLTAVDTSTESLAYYAVQVENFLRRLEALGQTEIASWTTEERGIAQTFIAHAKAIRGERAQAVQEQRASRVIDLLKSWGGSHLVYRKRVEQSPAYSLNHEELEKALEEGVTVLDQLDPVAIEVDAYGSARALVCKSADGSQITLAAGSIFIAAGTQPNTVLASEDPALYVREGKYLRALDLSNTPLQVEAAIAKPADPQFITHRFASGAQAGKSISMFGDVHPSYFGNVVKAMASAKAGAPVVHRELSLRGGSVERSAQVVTSLLQQLDSKVFAVHRLTPTIVEVIVSAPLAARNFEPGQFYRLQNFPSRDQNDSALMEGLALTGAWVDKQRGLVSMIVLEMGGSSNLCNDLRPGEPVVLMGPTGTPTHIEAHKNVMLVGGGLGNAVLFSIGKAMRAAGSHVIYFAGYKKLQDRYKVADIEAACDQVVWCCDEAPGFEPNPQRPQDMSFVGNMLEAIEHYQSVSSLGKVDHVIAIGSDRMMAAIAQARAPGGKLHAYLPAHHTAVASINSPMQCMMKEVCGQCIQRHIDPHTGETRVVFSCMNQDQDMGLVDWPGLNDRLQQNAMQEKLTREWRATVT
jgi:NADPH-dependent glutamate synthase beta subunit-like oxidoreductase/NAD(P)H-flavin reductase